MKSSSGPSSEAVQRAAARLREIETAAAAGLRQEEITWAAREILLAAMSGEVTG